MKKVLAVLLATLLAMGVLPTFAFAADSDFVIENGVLTKYNGPGGDVVIPDRVTEIGYQAFYKCENLASVKIPDSVTSIGGYAFSNCKALTNIEIPVGVTSIEECAFVSCTSLTGIIIPDGVTSIRYGTFSYCENLTSIKIPDSVTSIGNRAFSYCENLTSIIIPDSVTSIDSYAFWNCKGLVSIEIPKGVTEIGEGAFRACWSLTSVRIPGKVTKIGSYVFKGCISLQSIEISDGVTNTGIGTFEECESLTSLTIPNSFQDIKSYAFSQCTSLTSIIIPRSVTRIGDCAFLNTALTDVYYAGSEAEWKKIEVKDKTGPLLNATIHYNSTGLGGAGNDPGPTPSKPTPTPETKYIDGVLRQSDGCKVLWQCSYQEDKNGQPQNGKVTIFTSATDGEKEELFLFNEGVESGLPYPWELEPYNLPKSAITELKLNGESAKQLRVPPNAFRGYTNLNHVSMNCVSAVDSYAFSGCGSLAALSINDVLTAIGPGAFQNCSLGTVLMGEKLSNIADDAFTGCSKLKIRCYEDSYVHRYAESHNIPFELINDIAPQISVPFYIADKSITMKIDWDPKTMFAQDARKPSNELAIAGIVLSGAVENGLDYTNQVFSAMGFSSPDNIGYDYMFSVGRPALSIGTQQIRVNGKTKTLISVAIRGTSNWQDLITDAFAVGDGFYVAGTYTKDQLDKFIKKNCPSLKKEDTLLFITGHSLGGAAAGHLSRLCVQDGLVDLQNCFTYTYGCPKNYNIYDQNSNSVHNIINVNDVITAIPPNYFIHIGKDYQYKSDGSSEFAETYKALSGVYPGFMWALEKHFVGTYMALLLSGTPFEASGSFNHRLVRILCPVDVEVFDSAGNIVGRVVDNQVDKTIVSDKVLVGVIDDHKYIYLFDDDAYSFKVTGTDSGTLEYGVQDYAADGSLITEKKYTNVTLKNGKKLSSAVGGSTDTPDVKLLVLGTDGKPEKEVLPDGTGTEVPIASEPTAPPTPTPRPSGGGGGGTISMYGITVHETEHGKITADRSSAYSGAVVTLTAEPNDGYRLQELSVTDSQGKTIEVTEKSGKYTFSMPSRNVTITAKFVSASTLTPTPPSTPTPTPAPPAFPDVKDNEWYREAVEFVCTNGLMNGYSNGRFGPNDNLSRAQFAQILYNKEGRPTITGEKHFIDVADNQWYAAAINWAQTAGVVSGYGNGRFGPSDNITREQLATMLWRYAGSPQAPTDPLDFFDANKVSDYAEPAMEWAVRNGIVKGKGNKTLDPKGFATRAEVAQMLMNYLSK